MNKQDFPLLQSPSLVYLDNAATTQKPTAVIERITKFYTEENANVHRGNYPLSELASDVYEQSRQTVAKFIGAKQQEVVFTSGTTESSNMITQMLARASMISRDTKVVITVTEHHANMLPWQQTEAQITFATVEQLVAGEQEADIIVTAHASNVTGQIIDLANLRIKYPNSLIIVDAAQTAAHLPINVSEMGVDALFFSGHKLYGPTGIGVLYAKEELLRQLNPTKVGGGIVGKVTKLDATWKDIPTRFEAGTPPIAQAAGLAAAISYIDTVGLKKISNYEHDLSEYAFAKLSQVEGIEIYSKSQNNVGVFSFNIDGIHAHDISHLLGDPDFGKHKLQIATRAGHHCAQIFHREVLEIPASVRASIALYNDQSDIDNLVNKLVEVTDFLG